MSARIAVTEQVLKRGADQSESDSTSAGPSIPLMRNLDSEAKGLGVFGRAQGLGAAGIFTHTQPVNLPPVPGAGDSFKSVSLPQVPQSSALQARGADPFGSSNFAAPGMQASLRSAPSTGDPFSEPGMPSKPAVPVSPPLTAPATPFENVAAAAARMENGIGKGGVGRSDDTSSTLDNALSSVGQAQANLGNLFQDTKRSINPVLQFGKEIVKLVAGTFVAFINFFFKPKT